MPHLRTETELLPTPGMFDDLMDGVQGPPSPDFFADLIGPPTGFFDDLVRTDLPMQPAHAPTGGLPPARVQEPAKRNFLDEVFGAAGDLARPETAESMRGGLLATMIGPDLAATTANLAKLPTSMASGIADQIYEFSSALKNGRIAEAGKIATEALAGLVPGQYAMKGMSALLGDQKAREELRGMEFLPALDMLAVGGLAKIGRGAAQRAATVTEAGRLAPEKPFVTNVTPETKRGPVWPPQDPTARASDAAILEGGPDVTYKISTALDEAAGRKKAEPSHVMPSGEVMPGAEHPPVSGARTSEPLPPGGVKATQGPSARTETPGKQPWEMTRADYSVQRGETIPDDRHYRSVREAVYLEKNVPLEVLRDYPDLMKMAQAKARERTTAAVQRDLASRPATMKAKTAAEIAAEKRAKPKDAYLNEMVNYGGEQVPRGAMIADLQKKGVPQAQIDRYMQGSDLMARGGREAIEGARAVPPIKPPEPPAKVPVAPEEGPSRPGKVVSMRKADVEAIYKDLNDGEDLPPSIKRGFDEDFDIAANSGLANDALTFTRAARDSNRPLSSTEHVAATQKYVQLKDELKESRAALNAAMKKGDDNAVSYEMARTMNVLDQTSQLVENVRENRSEAGRALGIGRLRIDTETFELSSMLQVERAAKGSALTPKEIANTEATATRIAGLEKEVETARADAQKIAVERDKLVAQRVTANEARKAKIERRTADLRTKIQAERADIKKQLAGLGYRLNDITGVSAEGSYLVGRLAVNYIKEGAVDLGDVVKKVLADLPDLTERDVYAALNAKDPSVQARARSATQKQIAELKVQARLILEVEKAEQGIFEPRKPGAYGLSEVPAIRNLQVALRDLRNQAYKTGMAPERLEKAIRTINELQDRLVNHKRAVKKVMPGEPTPELAGFQEKIRELRREMRTEDASADLSEQLRTGDFKIRERPVARPVSLQLERKQIELRRLKREWRDGVESRKPLTVGKVAGESLNTMRTLKATADMSGFFRQNIIPVLSHPIKSAKQIPDVMRATFSEFKADQIDNGIRESPNAHLYDRAKLDIVERGATRATRREESFMSRLVEKVPVLGEVVKASERNMTTLGNLLRTSMFDDFLAKNPNATTVEMQAYAKALNVFSGRGDLGRFATAANYLSTVIFAPRLGISRFQTPYMVVKSWEMPRVRKAVARDLAGFVGTGNAILGLAYLYSLDEDGVSVGTDPRSADFGKIRVGDTRIDIWGGFQQPARLVTRLAIRGTDRLGWTGEDLKAAEKDVDPLELIGRFASYKVAPSVSLGLELMTGKTAVGDSTTVLETAARAVTPLLIEDIRDAYKEGMGRAAVTGGLAFFGVGVSTYRDSEREVRRKAKELFRSGKDAEANKMIEKFNSENPNNRIKHLRD